MRSRTVFAILALIVVASFVPLGAYAKAGVAPQAVCATYLTNLTVDFISSSPIEPKVGDIVATTFHVVYPDGTPVTLSPETASFLWVGSAGQKQFDNVTVTPTGNPGFYNYTQTFTADVAQAALGAAGTGKITVKVGFCSCSDSLGNRGPTNDIGSDETLTPSDSSNLNVQQPPTPGTIPISYLIPILIAILLLIALLLFYRRSRKKK